MLTEASTILSFTESPAKTDKRAKKEVPVEKHQQDEEQQTKKAVAPKKNEKAIVAKTMGKPPEVIDKKPKVGVVPGPATYSVKDQLLFRNTRGGKFGMNRDHYSKHVTQKKMQKMRHEEL